MVLKIHRGEGTAFEKDKSMLVLILMESQQQ